MKKAVAMMLALTLTMGCLVGCGSGSNDTPKDDAPATDAPADEPADEPADDAADDAADAPADDAGGEDPYADLGDFTMTVGHAQPEGNPRYVSMEKFAEDVAAKTNGHVTVTVMGNGQLGTEKEMLEAGRSRYDTGHERRTV